MFTSIQSKSQYGCVLYHPKPKTAKSSTVACWVGWYYIFWNVHISSTAICQKRYITSGLRVCIEVEPVLSTKTDLICNVHLMPFPFYNSYEEVVFFLQFSMLSRTVYIRLFIQFIMIPVFMLLIETVSLSGMVFAGCVK